jgi:ubiquinone/menaquinone biosynthesis C-methylase UbiE
MNSQWKAEKLSLSLLENVRGAIPSAETQIEVLLKIVSIWNPEIKNVIDLGCGNGILGRFIQSKFPSINLFCLDFSDAMLEAAQKSMRRLDSVHFIKSDFSTSAWKDPLNLYDGFDLIVSGFSIHHQSDKRKREIHGEIYELLNPNGIFLNLEHVSSATKEVGLIFDDYFIDKLYSFHSKTDPDADRKKIADNYYNRPDKVENI